MNSYFRTCLFVLAFFEVRAVLSQSVCYYDTIEAIRCPISNLSRPSILPTTTAQDISTSVTTVTETSVSTFTNFSVSYMTVATPVVSSIQLPPLVVTKTKETCRTVVSVVTSSRGADTVTLNSICTRMFTKISSQLDTVSVRIPTTMVCTVIKPTITTFTLTTPDLFVLTNTITCMKNRLSTVTVPSCEPYVSISTPVSTSTTAEKPQAKCFLVHPEHSHKKLLF